MKRGFVCLLLLAVLLGLTGCADGGPEQRADRVSITMHLWDKSMCRELTLWLEQQRIVLEQQGVENVDDHIEALLRNQCVDLCSRVYAARVE